MNNLVIIDTNVLVSGLLNPNGKPAVIIRMMITNFLLIVLDNRIFQEYRVVLSRTKFQFSPDDIEPLLSFFKTNGLWILPPPMLLHLPDPSDLPFIELAHHTHAPVITGNRKHFPDDIIVMTPSEFLQQKSMNNTK
jgi:putative PIN family toxin of toxin-antitoxin system